MEKGPQRAILKAGNPVKLLVVTCRKGNRGPAREAAMRMQAGG